MLNKTLKLHSRKNVNKTLKKGNLTSWQCFLKKKIPRMKGHRINRVKQASKIWNEYGETEKEKYLNCKNKNEELDKLIKQFDKEINNEASIPELEFTQIIPNLDALEITMGKCSKMLDNKTYKSMPNFNKFQKKYIEASDIIENNRINKDNSIININDELHNEDQSPEKLNKIRSQAILNNLNGYVVDMLNVRETQLKDLKNKIEEYKSYDKMSPHDLSFECKKLKKYIDTIKNNQKDLVKTDLFQKLEKLYDNMLDSKNKNKEHTIRNKSKHLKPITHKIKLIN